MSDRRDGAPQQQVDRLHVEDSCRTARSSPTCPSLQALVNALFHLAAWIAPGDYAPGAVTGAVVSISATGYFFAWSDARPAPPRPNSSSPSRSAPSLRRSRSGSCSCPDRGAGFRPDSAQTARYLTNQTISQNAGALGQRENPAVGTERWEA